MAEQSFDYESLRLPPRVAMAESVADQIAWSVATGEFVSGDKLNEAILGDRTGASRVTIREALKVLCAQGIVTGEQNRGYRVAPLDAQTISNVLEVRKALESILLRDAILRWRETGDKAAALDQPLADMLRAAEAGDRIRSLMADLDFHRAIAASSGNEVTRILWEAIARHVLIIFSQHAYRDDDLFAVYGQHQAFKQVICQMINSSADAETIKLEIEDHLMQVARGRQGS